MEVMPIDLTALVAVIMGCLIVLIPVAGLTARYAIKPIAEALARARDTGSSKETVAMLERRMTLLEQEIQSLGGVRDEMGRVLEEMEFHRKLGAPQGKQPAAGEPTG